MDELKGWHSRGYLSHFDGGGVYQFITFRLCDSVPKGIIMNWSDELAISDTTEKNSEDYIKLHNRIAKYEDKGYGECFLKNRAIAKLVEDALKFYDNDRYELIEWVIMPNHVHVLIKGNPNHSLTMIVHSWKSYTASKANEILGRKGKFWMNDYFDRYIRNDKHFNATIEYIRENGKTWNADIPVRNQKDKRQR